MLLCPRFNAIPIPALVLDVKIWFWSAVIRNPVKCQEGYVRFAHWSEVELACVYLDDENRKGDLLRFWRRLSMQWSVDSC